MKNRLALGVAAILAAALLTACEEGSTITRTSQAVVLTGADLPALVGEDPDDIVAFAHRRVDGQPTWTQIPVQVDERKLVGFGSQPSSNSTPGVTGTVYGNGAPGVLHLQYADPETFVGADPDPTFDADDELVFMLEDAGGVPRDGEETEPPGVDPGSGVRVRLDDPLSDGGTGYVHLFTSGTLDPSAGRDYVDYDFELTSGDYRLTYKRADGPNPETSSVTTETYSIGYSDRWFEDRWQVHAGDATGVDVLDGNKNQFALGFCGRSNLTFADAEGAFVANIDGPVRGIRSYVGANSGPLTQRTHLMYRHHTEIATDLRVHSIPGVMDFLDYSTAALGMTYHSSVLPGGVTIDRVPDPAVGTEVPEWELVTGPQGSITTALEWETDIEVPGGYENAVDWLYLDQANPSDAQCWGDAHYTGAHGSWVVEGIPNTDPRTTPFKSLHVERSVQFSPPGVTGVLAAAWAEQVRTPVTATVSPYAP